MPRSGVVHLACSSGGHLDLLVRVMEALDPLHRVWITQPSERASDLVRRGEEVHLVPAWDREPGRRMAANLARSARLVARHRPRLVVTSGSGLIVPYCVMARAAGARLLFAETTARVRSPSASGRVLSRLASDVLVQWPSMAAVYPGAAVCRPPVLDAVTPATAPPDGGTFVTVGTHVQPFDRLLRAVDAAAEAGVLPRPVVVQRGASELALAHADRVHDLLTPDAVTGELQAARVVVTHAGTGSVTAALRSGRRPVVMARLAREGEHFDDHQRELAGELERLGLVVPVEGAIDEAAVRRATAPLGRPDAARTLPAVHDALAERVAALAR